MNSCAYISEVLLLITDKGDPERLTISHAFCVKNEKKGVEYIFVMICVLRWEWQRVASLKKQLEEKTKEIRYMHMINLRLNIEINDVLLSTSTVWYLRRMKGDEIDELDLVELRKLERWIENSLSRVIGFKVCVLSKIVVELV